MIAIGTQGFTVLFSSVCKAPNQAPKQSLLALNPKYPIENAKLKQVKTLLPNHQAVKEP